MIDPLNPKPPPGREREYWERFAKSAAYRKLMQSEMRYFGDFWRKQHGEKARHAAAGGKAESAPRRRRGV